MSEDDAGEKSIEEIIQLIRKLPVLLIPRIEDGGNLIPVMIEGLRNITDVFCDRGFLRTHAFLSSWLHDYSVNGTLHEKEIQEIVDSCPWNRDQTRKYLDTLEKNNYLITERNTKKNKVYRLNFSLTNPCSPDLHRMLTFYSKFYKADTLTENQFNDVLLSYRNCIRKLDVFRIKKEKFTLKSQNISLATDDQLTNFKDQLIRTYTEIQEDFQDATVRLVKVLLEQPLLVKGLSKKR